MPALDLKSRTTGMIITLYWSRTGKDWKERRIRWGQTAVKWGGVKLGGDRDGFGLWELPKSVNFNDVNQWFEANLKKADRVAVVFPFGKVKGASAMSVHTHNIN